MSLEVVVKNKVAFDRGYEEKIDEAYQVYKVWIDENLGYEVPHRHSYVSYERTTYFQFKFANEEDAMAFKLRWL